MPHSDNESIVRGEIIQKSYPVHFMKFVPDNIVNYSFVTLVCIGIYNHLSLVPERILANIKSNLIKTYFNKETLSEIHISLNNIDKLRYLIGKVYKTLHPFGQDIIGVYHNISIADSNLVNYVCKIAQKLIILEWFQIDISFKWVKGEINEFEINICDTDYHLTTHAQKNNESSSSLKKKKLNKSKKSYQEEAASSENETIVIPKKSRYSKEKDNALFELKIKEKRIAIRERSMKLRADKA
ncbi:hypothetical protein C1645_813468 [Glomus cerebriforme]|uniref:Uncharacterized protein n=1 Tax=Glomus cerebriforme TaxID=658196 RepID=A0A397TS81_9GLOM|nr:hypothetical protein C1645_813468 [Glomus cerebriforme]